MEIVPEIGQKFDAIIDVEGPASRAQSALTEAVVHLFVSNRDLAYVLDGSEQTLPAEVAEQLRIALDKTTEARNLVTSAIGGIATVRANILGENVPGAATKTRVISDALGTSAPSPLVPERSMQPPARVLFWNSKNDAYVPQIPNQELRDQADAAIQEHYKTLKRFYDFLEHSPNSNDQFGAELAEIRHYLRDADLPDVPVVILPNEQFEQSCNILYPGEDVANVDGYERGGVAIIRDNPQSLERRIFGNHHISDTILHEAGHAFGHEDALFVIVRKHREPQTYMHFSGFMKFNLTYGRSDGEFLEEGDADLTRVDASVALGKAITMREKERLEFDTVYIPEHQTPELPSLKAPALEIPARFLSGLARKSSGAPAFQYPLAAVAAYGLELLYNEVPGLREDMKDVRMNAASQAKIIRHIDSVKPGLYAQLRNLPYSKSGFYRGLRIVGQAIRDRK